MRKAFFLLLLLPLAAVANTDSLLRVAAGMRQTDTGLVHIYTRIATSYLGTGDTAKALLYLVKSKDLSVADNFPRGIIDGWNNIGMFYMRYGASDAALAAFTRSFAKATESNDADAASKSCINIASVYLRAAGYQSAIQYYIKALGFLEKVNDQPRIAVDYNCIGTAYYLLKNYPLSLKYYNLSLAVGKKMGKPDESGYNHNGIGVVYKELGKYDSAAFYLDMARAAAEKNGDHYLLSHNLSDRGEVYSRIGDRANALRCLSAALPMHREMSDERGVAETCILLGDLYSGERNFHKAQNYFDTARNIAAAAGFKDVLKNAWKGLATAYKGLSNYPGAFDAYQHYADLKDTIYSEESSKQIAEMQTRYNTEKKEKENILLQKENAVKNLQIQRGQNQKNTLIILFAFLVIIAAIYYNWYRLKQNNKLLKERELRAFAVFQAQEDEKVKLSKDLHDGVGAVLSLIKLNISSIKTDATNEQLLTSTKKLATDAIKEVRGISHDLMPGLLMKAGLKAALTELAEQIAVSAGIDVTLHYELEVRLLPATERNLFRIVQEATNNIMKHAAATTIVVTLVNKNEDIVLNVTDNGIGFDKALHAEISGNGLNNIYSRADLLKGKTEITTAKGCGTSINIAIPLKSNA
jgi:two-component system NarL family sensor kinase